jgi:hypothetical protein
MCRTPLGSETTQQFYSAAQALHASPQALHAATLGYFSHSFWQSLQSIETTLAKWGVCLRIDRRQSRKRAATSNELEGRIDAFGHARVLHFVHAEAMPEADAQTEKALAAYSRL